MNYKFCSICKENKERNLFPKRGKGVGPWCYPCKRLYDRLYWEKTKKIRNDRKKLNNQKIFDRNYEFVISFLLKNPCEICGEQDPIVLQFDHIDPKLKLANISNLCSSSASSIKKIKKEIEKCRVLCANCHTRHTAKQRNFRTLRVLERLKKQY